MKGKYCTHKLCFAGMASNLQLLAVIVLIITTVLIPSANGMKSKSESGHSGPGRSSPTNPRDESGGDSGSHRSGNSGSKASDSSGMNSGDTDSDTTDLDNTGDDSGRSSDGNSESGSMDSDHTEHISGSKSKGSGSSGSQSGGESSSSESSSSEEGQSDRMSTTPLTTRATTSQTTEFQETTVVTLRELEPCLGGNFTLNGVIVSFPTSEVGDVVNSTQRCPSGSSYMNFPLAARRCNRVWDDPEFNTCFNQEDLKAELDHIAKTNITKDNVTDVVLILLLASNQQEELTKEEVDLVQQILSRVVQMNDESPQVTDSIVGVIDSIMELDEDVLSQIPNAPGFVENLEDQITNIQKGPGNYSEVLENLAVEAVKINRSSLETPYQFKNPLTRKRGNNRFRSSSITLPPEILDIIEKAWPDINKIPLTFLAFRESNLFVTNQSNTQEKGEDLSTRQDMTSQVISATVDLDDVTIANLSSSSRVVIRFESENDQARDDDEGEPSCVFWDYCSVTRRGEWSTAGCTTLHEGNKIICSCNHLTSFAVLFFTDSLNGVK